MQIKWDIRARAVAKGKYCRTNENLMLCNSWGIPDRILVQFDAQDIVVQQIVRGLECWGCCSFLQMFSFVLLGSAMAVEIGSFELGFVCNLFFDCVQ